MDTNRRSQPTPEDTNTAVQSNDVFLANFVDGNRTLPLSVKQFIHHHIEGKHGFWNRKTEEGNAVRSVVFDPVENVVVITLGDNVHVRWKV